MSIDRGMNKDDVVCVCVCVCNITYMYTHTMEFYSAIKKKEISPFVATWIDLESVILSEVSQREKKYHRTSLKCGT